jgi:hypothetical protein
MAAAHDEAPDGQEKRRGRAESFSIIVRDGILLRSIIADECQK